jgi:hypothetical protein
MHLIYRYSKHGFNSQHQGHLLKDSMVSLEEMLKQCTTDYMKNLIKSNYVEVDPNFEFDGIFIFLNKPTLKDKEFYLNHLKTNLDDINLNVAKIDPSAICYLDDGFVFREKNRMTIDDALKMNYNTVYIPDSQISKIQLIRKNKLRY